MLGSPNAHLSESSRYRNTLRRIVLKLAITYDILPTALALEEVQCDDREVHGAGGHADVYCGNHRDLKVALKRLRVYISAPEVRKYLIKRVSLQFPFILLTFTDLLRHSHSTESRCCGRILSIQTSCLSLVLRRMSFLARSVW